MNMISTCFFSLCLCIVLARADYYDYQTNVTFEEYEAILCPMSSTWENMHNNIAHCNSTWDGILCWPPTRVGVTQILPCMEKIKDIYYDTSRKFIYRVFFLKVLNPDQNYWQKFNIVLVSRLQWSFFVIFWTILKNFLFFI